MKNARDALEDAYALAIVQGATPAEAELIGAKAYSKAIRKGRRSEKDAIRQQRRTS